MVGRTRLSARHTAHPHPRHTVGVFAVFGSGRCRVGGAWPGRVTRAPTRAHTARTGTTGTHTAHAPARGHTRAHTAHPRARHTRAPAPHGHPHGHAHPHAPPHGRTRHDAPTPAPTRRTTRPRASHGRTAPNAGTPARRRPPAMPARRRLWTTCGQPPEEPCGGLWTTCGQSYPQLWISPADFFRGSGLRWVAPRQPYYNFQIEQSEISIKPT